MTAASTALCITIRVHQQVLEPRCHSCCCQLGTSVSRWCLLDQRMPSELTYRYTA